MRVLVNVVLTLLLKVLTLFEIFAMPECCWLCRDITTFVELPH